MERFLDRVVETTTTVGTGDLTLGGAVTGYRAFSVANDGDTFGYAIESSNLAEWESGIGTYHSGTNTMTRTTVKESSNANALVNFSAGTKRVFITLLGSQVASSSFANHFLLMGA